MTQDTADNTGFSLRCIAWKGTGTSFGWHTADCKPIGSFVDIDRIGYGLDNHSSNLLDSGFLDNNLDMDCSFANCSHFVGKDKGCCSNIGFWDHWPKFAGRTVEGSGPEGMDYRTAGCNSLGGCSYMD